MVLGWSGALLICLTFVILCSVGKRIGGEGGKCVLVSAVIIVGLFFFFSPPLLSPASAYNQSCWQYWSEPKYLSSF